MTNEGFPRDDYTPHGLLANPYAVAHSWKDSSGGVLRTSREGIGVGWVYPWALGTEAYAELRVEVEQGERPFLGEADNLRDRVRAPHHSARLLELAWEAFGYRWTASFVLVGADHLGLVVAAERDLVQTDRDSGHSTAADQVPYVRMGLHGWRKPMEDRRASVVATSQDRVLDGKPLPGGCYVGSVSLGAPYGIHALYVDGSDALPPTLLRDAPRPDTVGGDQTAPDAGHVDIRVAVPEAHESGVVLRAIVQRQADRDAPATLIVGLSERVSAAVERARAEDDALWSGGARLTGDWPDAWRRGWVYDLETTRMCVYPAGGVFTDVWPSWMVQWPRAVVAEGTLDMVRLAYLSPDLAKRAVLSLFRDAPAPNVPCIFQHGEPNMVARDGSVCGTSPAWCVPFYNVERLYLLTLDDVWLADLYPYLARYVDWWLAERTDPDGWAVYKCTWEAGEDDSPRLDPDRRGDNVVSEYVRPVELQATMALSASVLARFADVLGRADEAARWRSVAATYAEKTRTLWDPAAGRFRDWDARAGRFLEPAGEANYWGIDPSRFSALAFTPVLAELADAEQRAALAREIELYDRPPWTLWASWSYVILETALAAGWRGFAARVTAGIIGRVYPELDRRTVRGNEPTPGAAREYWPLEISEWRSCDGYGWGATTASFLARQVFGLLEGGYPAHGVEPDQDRAPAAEGPDSSQAASPVLDADLAAPRAPSTSSLTLRLAPGLPAELLVEGRRYALVNVPYRGTHVSVEYVVERVGPEQSQGAALVAQVTTPDLTMCRVLDDGCETTHETGKPARAHHFEVRNGGLYLVELRLG